MTLKGKVALVTGSSRGIGAAVAHRFAAQGAQVVLNCRKDKKRAEALSKRIAEEGGKALLIPADVGRPRDVEALFAEIDNTFGRIDILVAAAGSNRDLPIEEMRLTDFEVAIRSQLYGTFLTSREAAIRMRRQGNGDILMIGASTGIRGRKNGANYCAAKAGVMVLTKCFALEFAPHVRVNALVPGFTETEDIQERFRLRDGGNRRALEEGIPMGRLAHPEEVAEWAEWVVSGAPYATGSLFFVNGGSYMG